MNEIKISGNIHNIMATDVHSITFAIGQGDSAPLCAIEGTKAAVLYSLLIDGDLLNVTGIMADRNGVPYIQVNALNVVLR